MPKGKSKKITIKTYDQNQAYLLPPSIQDLIPANHFVRTFNSMIEQLDLDPLLRTYKGGGASIFHPKMMVKVIVWAYLNKIFSSRRIAKSLREDILFKYLAGMQTPDFRTINKFRSSHLKGVIDQVFASQVEFCLEQGYIKLENYFVDATKIEANANRNSYVWGKNVIRHKATTQQKVIELLKYIEQVNQQEDLQYKDRDLEELGENIQVNAETIKEHIIKLKQELAEKHQQGQLSGVDKQVEKAITKIEKSHLPKLEQYEQQQENLAGRNSYSKTDVDATFCRLKNGLLRPGYNAMIGTENQFIINFTIHRNPGESGLLIPHLEKLNQLLGMLPENVIGDAAFGSHENYQYIDQKKIGNYLKYNTFEIEQTQPYPFPGFSRTDFVYQPDDDVFICPAGEQLHFVEIKQHQTDNGFTNFLRVYECNHCNGCDLKKDCAKNKDKKTLNYNPQLERYRAQARVNLNSPSGIKLRNRRSVEPETVFGDIKWNQQFTRFQLRGLDKVSVEWGLLSLAHNFKKMLSVKSNKNENPSIDQIEFCNPVLINRFYFFSLNYSLT